MSSANELSNFFSFICSTEAAEYTKQVVDEVQPIIGSICKPNHSWGAVFCPDFATGARPANVR